MNRFLKISVWVLTVAAIGALWFFTRKDYTEDRLHRVDFKIVNGHGFINYDRELGIILAICDTASNRQVTDIPVDSVRKTLAENPWATDVRANLSLRRILNIEMTECQPIMRIYNDEGKSLYLDKDGNIFPVGRRYIPHVLICSGHFSFPVTREKWHNVNDSVYASTDLPGAFDVASSILNDDYASQNVGHIYLAKNRQYELVVRNSDLHVILGYPDNVSEKLLKMKYFFDRMMGREELNGYSKINLNYKNQVVCTKK